MANKLLLPRRAPRTEPGDVRSSVTTGYFTVPWDYPEHRIPYLEYLRKFVAQMEREGWRFERVLEMKRDPIPTFNPDGEGRKTFIMRCLFSKPARRYTMEMPESIAQSLLRVNPRKFQLAR